VELIKREKKIQKMISAVCFSLLIHAGVGTLLVFSPSNDPISPPSLNGLNFVWVSLNVKNNGITVQKTLPHQLALKEKRLVINSSEPKEQNSKPRTASIFTAMESAHSIKLVSYKGYDKYDKEATEETSSNMNGQNTNQTAGDISRTGALTAYPLYRENMPPVYPEIARVRGYEGVVLVAAEILPNGRVGNIKIRKSSGYAILDQSALEGVKPWKFEPAKKSGKPFTIWVEVPIKFVLHNDNSRS
jgi:TonB family protein